MATNCSLRAQEPRADLRGVKLNPFPTPGIFLNVPLAPRHVRPPVRGDPLDPAGVPHGFRELSGGSFQLFIRGGPSSR